MSLYQKDLAYIQAVAFGALARGAAPEVVRRLRHASIPIRRVVDMGCGAGPLTEALVAEGFETTGIDSSAELLAVARAAVPTARFIHASAYDAGIPPCEAIVALGEPLTYHQSRISGFFQSAAALLPPGGVLIFDIIETGEPSLSRRTWSSGDDWAVLVDTTEDERSQTLTRNIETFRKVGESYRRGREVHRVQLFDTRWLCDELASRGFEVETSQAYGTQPLAPRRRAFFATRRSSS
jgi:SAM-dependent methyltransferase